VQPRYDAIGGGYARFRREDPRFRARIRSALGPARSVVNVGAGAGSYEPDDLQVIAVEPSAVMLAQRAPGAAHVIRAHAGQLPLRKRSVDAAMAILSLHHWDAQRERGVRELRRVARGPVVLVTYDARVSGQMWLMTDYLPEVAALDRAIFPDPEQLAAWLGGDVVIEPLPIPRDTPDWMLGSYWAHPERVLDAQARAATSGFARMPAEVVARVVGALGRDLEDGSWERKYGWLRGLSEFDVGLRLIVSSPASRAH
jgi:SAM-dependent methyltransferase